MTTDGKAAYKLDLDQFVFEDPEYGAFKTNEKEAIK
jgi:hypothetical protein